MTLGGTRTHVNSVHHPLSQTICNSTSSDNDGVVHNSQLIITISQYIISQDEAKTTKQQAVPVVAEQLRRQSRHPELPPLSPTTIVIQFRRRRRIHHSALHQSIFQLSLSLRFHQRRHHQRLEQQQQQQLSTQQRRNFQRLPPSTMESLPQNKLLRLPFPPLPPPPRRMGTPRQHPRQTRATITNLPQVAGGYPRGDSAGARRRKLFVPLHCGLFVQSCQWDAYFHGFTEEYPSVTVSIVAFEELCGGCVAECAEEALVFAG